MIIPGITERCCGTYPVTVSIHTEERILEITGSNKTTAHFLLDRKAVRRGDMAGAVSSALGNADNANLTYARGSAMLILPAAVTASDCIELPLLSKRRLKTAYDMTFRNLYGRDEAVIGTALGYEYSDNCAEIVTHMVSTAALTALISALSDFGIRVRAVSSLPLILTNAARLDFPAISGSLFAVISADTHGTLLITGKNAKPYAFRAFDFGFDEIRSETLLPLYRSYGYRPESPETGNSDSLVLSANDKLLSPAQMLADYIKAFAAGQKEQGGAFVLLNGECEKECPALSVKLSECLPEGYGICFTRNDLKGYASGKSAIGRMNKNRCFSLKQL